MQSQKHCVNSSELMHCCQMILAISSSEVLSEPCHSRALVILQMQMCLREAKLRAFCEEESTASCDTQLLECCHEAREIQKEQEQLFIPARNWSILYLPQHMEIMIVNKELLNYQCQMARLNSSTQVLLERSLLCAKELLVWEESSSSCPNPEHLTITDEITDVASSVLKRLFTVLSAIL